MPDPTTRVADSDVDDSTETTPQALTNRIQSVGRVVMQMNNRLVKIKAVMGLPPDDQKPEMIAALTELKTQALAVSTTSDEMLVIVTGPGTPPSDVIP